MGVPKPIAGYPSRTAACLALSAGGLSSRQIGDQLGLDPSTVAAFIAYHMRRTGGTRAAEGPLAGGGRAVAVPADILDALLPHAARRGIDVHKLVRDFLGVIVDDSMVDSVLDDGAELAPALPARSAA